MIPSLSGFSLFSKKRMVKVHQLHMHLPLFVMPPAAPSLGLLGPETIPVILGREKGICLVLLTVALGLWQSSLGLFQQGQE